MLRRKSNAKPTTVTEVLEGSVYDTTDLNAPPPIAESRAAVAALECEEFEDEKNKKNPERNMKTKRQAFIDGMRSLWLTREGADKDRTLLIKITLRELITYIFFLIIACIVAFSLASTTAFYYEKTMNTLFVANTLTKVSQMDDIWHVRNDSCEVPSCFRRAITECFAEYSSGSEDRETFGPNFLGSPFVYHTAEELNTPSYWGQITTYPGGGFVQYLPMDDINITTSVIEYLKSNRWIDRGTRVIFVEFSLYNGNINLFCVIKLVFELPASGGVYSSASMNVERLIAYVTSYDYFVYVCELLFCAFVLYYIVEEVLEMVRSGSQYITSFWNCLNVLNLAVCVTVIYYGVRRFCVVQNVLNTAMLQMYDNVYVNLDYGVQAENDFSTAAAILLIFAWIKTIRYISFNKTMTQLNATLARSAKDIGGFSIMFFIFFFAYAQFGYLVFGDQIADYSTLYNAVFALLRTILGDFDFYALENADRILGPLFFLTYVFFVFFVLLNMFLAIINDSYVEVKSELARQGNDVEMTDVVSDYVFNFLERIGMYKRKAPPEETDYECLRGSLKAQGFTDAEITDAFVKYDVTNRKLELEEMQLVIDQLQADKGIVTASRKKVSAKRDIFILNHRMDHLEDSIFGIVDQLDDIMKELKEMEVELYRTQKIKNMFMMKDRAALVDPYNLDFSAEELDRLKQELADAEAKKKKRELAEEQGIKTEKPETYQPRSARSRKRSVAEK